MAESQQNTNDIVKPPNLNPPIIMKIEAPVEDTNKEENDDDNEKTMFSSNNESVKVCSPSFKAAKPSSNPFACSQNKTSRGILKPPQLSLNNSTVNRTSFTLNPSRLNPFALPKPDAVEQKSDNSDKKCSPTSNGETPKFVPLIQSEEKSSTPTTPNKTSTTVSTTIATTNSFVFGQNLQERVMAVENKPDEPKPSTSLNSNGTTEMLFSSAIKNEVKTENNIAKEAKSLSESAREYEESRANKRKYEEVEVKTGEEEETNILSISCKLFAFDKISSSWRDRGRGTLRLNDFELEDGHTQSRLVFRTTGCLRVILNTKIWAEMSIQQASEKSIRLTALDPTGEIKVFLIMTNIEDSKQLYSHLQTRLQKEVTVQKRKKVHSDDTQADSGGQ